MTKSIIRIAALVAVASSYAVSPVFCETSTRSDVQATAPINASTPTFAPITITVSPKFGGRIDIVTENGQIKVYEYLPDGTKTDRTSEFKKEIESGAILEPLK